MAEAERILEAARWRLAGPNGAAERLGLRPTTPGIADEETRDPAPGLARSCHFLPVGSGTGTSDLVCGDAAGDLR
ncbi:MAG: hypothetical protein ACREWE_10860 [Gammaproteobacteria bacterium]